MLDVRDINLFYGAAQALRGVSIAAEPGKVMCVLGRNGVGKTSLLRAMVGQYPIASGSITFDGNDITGLKPYERARKGIGFVPQGREIFPLLTVEENLKTGFGPLKRDARHIPDDVFPVAAPRPPPPPAISPTTCSRYSRSCRPCSGAVAATSPAASSSSWRS